MQQRRRNLAADVEVGEHRFIDTVVIPHIAWGPLVAPENLAGIGVERKLGSRPKIGVLPDIRGVVTARLAAPGTAVAGRPINQVQLWVKGTHSPGRSGAGLPRIALPGVVARLAISGNGVTFPHHVAGFLIVRFDEAADTVL